jgi:hypothetical protein
MASVRQIEELHTVRAAVVRFRLGGRPEILFIFQERYSKGENPMTREQVLAWLLALSPEEARTLRDRFGIGDPGRSDDQEEMMLHALARELAILQKKN